MDGDLASLRRLARSYQWDEPLLLAIEMLPARVASSIITMLLSVDPVLAVRAENRRPDSDRWRCGEACIATLAKRAFASPRFDTAAFEAICHVPGDAALDALAGVIEKRPSGMDKGLDMLIARLPVARALALLVNSNHGRKVRDTVLPRLIDRHPDLVRESILNLCKRPLPRENCTYLAIRAVVDMPEMKSKVMAPLASLLANSKAEASLRAAAAGTLSVWAPEAAEQMLWEQIRNPSLPHADFVDLLSLVTFVVSARLKLRAVMERVKAADGVVFLSPEIGFIREALEGLFCDPSAERDLRLAAGNWLTLPDRPGYHITYSRNPAGVWLEHMKTAQTTDRTKDLQKVVRSMDHDLAGMALRILALARPDEAENAAIKVVESSKAEKRLMDAAMAVLGAIGGARSLPALAVSASSGCSLAASALDRLARERHALLSKGDVAVLRKAVASHKGDDWWEARVLSAIRQSGEADDWVKRMSANHLRRARCDDPTAVHRAALLLQECDFARWIRAQLDAHGRKGYPPYLLKELASLNDPEDLAFFERVVDGDPCRIEEFAGYLHRHGRGETLPLLSKAITSRTLDGVCKNMIRGIIAAIFKRLPDPDKDGAMEVIAKGTGEDANYLLAHWGGSPTHRHAAEVDC